MILRRRTGTITVAALFAATAAFGGWDEGVAAFKAGDYDQAAVEFQDFVSRHPDQHAGHLMLGHSLLLAGWPHDAVKPLRTAIAMRPTDIAGRVYLGRAFFRTDDWRNCIATLNRLDTQMERGKVPKEVQVQIHMMRAASHARLGDTANAAADLGRVADLKPDDATTRFEYGRMLQNDGQLDAAIAAYERAVSMDGSKPEWKTVLDDALDLKTRVQESERLEEEPSSSPTPFQRIRELERKRDELRQLLEQLPDSPNDPPLR